MLNCSIIHGHKVRERVSYRRLVAHKIQEYRVIHFVCFGNICRSPFAHYYAASLLAHAYTVKSSGIHAEGGRPCPGLAVEKAARFGVDLAGHRAAPLRLQGNEPDIYLVFDRWNQDLMVQVFPHTKGRVFPLGLFIENESVLFIEDPYGLEASVYNDTYQNIADAVDGLQQALSKV